jgi:hypothetical protein
MTGASSNARKRRRVAFDAGLLLVVVLLMTQMWLLTATLESYLAGHRETALPGVVVSGILAAACLGIYRLLVRLDRVQDRPRDVSQHGPWRIG